MMRLQKYLAHAGVCSRRKAEEHILNGHVQVNDTIVTQLGTQVDPVKDHIFFKNEPVRFQAQQKKIYIALNKPKGVVTSCAQEKTKVVLDLIDIDERVYPIGRLDKDSTGLLLLTNDGDLHNRMSHPSFNHEKEYVVQTQGPISENALKKMSQGMVINRVKTRKATVKRIHAAGFSIILKQGLNRQIRKMVLQVGNKVKSLNRIRMGSIRLGNLKQGQWRYLTSKEIKQLTSR